MTAEKMRNGLICFVPVMMTGFMYVGSMGNDRLMCVLPFSRKEKEKTRWKGGKGKGRGCNGLTLWQARIG